MRPRIESAFAGLLFVATVVACTSDFPSDAPTCTDQCDGTYQPSDGNGALYVRVELDQGCGDGDHMILSVRGTNGVTEDVTERCSSGFTELSWEINFDELPVGNYEVSAGVYAGQELIVSVEPIAAVVRKDEPFDVAISMLTVDGTISTSWAFEEGITCDQAEVEKVVFAYDRFSTGDLTLFEFPCAAGHASWRMRPGSYEFTVQLIGRYNMTMDSWVLPSYTEVEINKTAELGALEFRVPLQY